MVAAFVGHRNIPSRELSPRVNRLINDLVNTEPSLIFYVGGMGQFDSLAASAVRQCRKEHPHIRLDLVLPYMTNRINTEKEYFTSMYDEVIFPLDASKVHYKAAITLRNRWMVDHADLVIAYVVRDHGGAYTALQYAQKQKKAIINLAAIENFTCIFPLKRV